MHVVPTHHARRRLQTRSIQPEVIDLLLEFGASAHDHRGGEVVYFDRAGRRRLRRSSPDIYRRQSKALNAYAVLSGDGALITVGWRYRRLLRHS
jgi:hypothetical protein